MRVSGVKAIRRKKAPRLKRRHITRCGCRRRVHYQELCEKTAEAAVDNQKFSIEEAHDGLVAAVAAARKDQNDTENTVRANAEVIRADSRRDAELKRKNKVAECSTEASALKAEVSLIAQIKEKISALTTVRDDALGEKAEKDAEDFRLRFACATNCQNDGRCVKKTPIDRDYYCRCKNGFNGPHCENNIDECAGDPCENGGLCIDGVAKFTCTCVDGYEGETCSINIDDCLNNPCGAHGSCTDNVAHYTCTCDAGSE